MASYKDFLTSFCETSTQEETKQNLDNMVEYKKTIQQIDGEMFQAFDKLITKQANMIGLKDFDEESVKGYLLSDNLTSFNHLRYNESKEEMNNIVDGLMKKEGIYDPLNEHYINLINTSKTFKDNVANNTSYNITYIGDEPSLEESHFRDRVFSGSDRLFHSGDSESLNTYERVKLQRKALVIDEVLEDEEFDWSKYNVEIVEEEEETEEVEIEVEEDEEDTIKVGTKESFLKPKKTIKVTKPIQSNTVEDVVTLKPGKATLDLTEEESIDLPWFGEEEKKNQNTKFIPSTKHTVVWE